MGDCHVCIKEIRYLFDGDDGKGMMHIYVLGKAWGDCPMGTFGWFHKVLPPGSTMMDEEAGLQDYLMWDRGAPPNV